MCASPFLDVDINTTESPKRQTLEAALVPDWIFANRGELHALIETERMLDRGATWRLPVCAGKTASVLLKRSPPRCSLATSVKRVAVPP
jgi:hypothetical protein